MTSLDLVLCSIDVLMNLDASFHFCSTLEMEYTSNNKICHLYTVTLIPETVSTKKNNNKNIFVPTGSEEANYFNGKS